MLCRSSVKGVKGVHSDMKFLCWQKKNKLLKHTGLFGAGLFGGFAGLSRSYAVCCQDSELVLHPGIQVNDSG